MQVVIVLTLLTITVISGQQSFFNVLQCGNLNSGLCRLQCQSNELSVYPYTCSLYTQYFGYEYQRCVTSMPCCYYSGSCQRTCNGNQVQLSPAATCTNAGDVCCMQSSLLGATQSNIPTAATATTASSSSSSSSWSSVWSSPYTSAPTLTSVSARQGVCGSAVTQGSTNARRFSQQPPFSPRPRIIGGTVTQPTDWPWMVRITYTTSIGFCAGVLVDNDTVVTAAHCVAGIDKESMQVILGDHDVSTFDPDEEVVDVASYYIVSGFLRRRRGDDFAILKLARNVTFTDRKLPACLPDPAIPLASPPSCYIAGWGVSEQGIGGPLRAANAQLLNRTACEDRLSLAGQGPVTLPLDMVCTANPRESPTDGCLFDDGDMLVCKDVQNRWSLIGIMSEYSCGSALPILFTDVRNYTDITLNRMFA
ncbi:chymotrypsin-like elastase family member 2A [Littorina saxatilis]|uniref:Peptidase S1 domain-containing protein n=1 Tax=Littorina saxatilis TaxID=31220 RepID=A0AAN9BZY3_9CAEN